MFDCGLRHGEEICNKVLAQRRWTGHVIRMPDERLPKKVVY